MTEISEKTLLQSYRVTSMHSVTPFSEIYDHKQLFGKYAFTFWSSLHRRSMQNNLQDEDCEKICSA